MLYFAKALSKKKDLNAMKIASQQIPWIKDVMFDEESKF